MRGYEDIVLLAGFQAWREGPADLRRFPGGIASVVSDTTYETRQQALRRI